MGPNQTIDFKLPLTCDVVTLIATSSQDFLDRCCGTVVLDIKKRVTKIKVK